MKASGKIRRIDDLGRIVVPLEVRRSLAIKEGDPFEVMFDDNGVYFEKYRTTDAVIYLAEQILATLRESGELEDEDRELLLEDARKLLNDYTRLTN